MQEVSRFHASRAIELQHKCCNPSYSGKRFNACPIQREMIGPGLPSRIEQGNELTSLAIYSAYLTALKPITVEARPGQVIVAFSTPMLARHNVVRFVALDGVVLMKTAIFTAVAGPLSDSQALRGRNSHNVLE